MLTYNLNEKNVYSKLIPCTSESNILYIYTKCVCCIIVVRHLVYDNCFANHCGHFLAKEINC